MANIGSNNVSTFSINATTGALTSLGAPVATGTFPSSVAVDPFGKFVYVANYGSNTISAYTINARTGALTAGAAVAAGTHPNSIAVDPSGTIRVRGESRLRQRLGLHHQRHDRRTHQRWPPVAAGTNPNSIVVDPSGRFAYVANLGSDNVSAYAINATTGALTSLGTAVAAGTQPFSVTVDPSGALAYVTNFWDSTISVFTINAKTGVLRARSTLAGRSGNLAMAMSKGLNPVTYTPTFAYVANDMSDDVSYYTHQRHDRRADQRRRRGDRPASTRRHHRSLWQVCLRGECRVRRRLGLLPSIAATGLLTSLGATVAAGNSPNSVTVDPSGRFAYVANSWSDSVSAYTIDPATGALTSIGVAPAGTGPLPVAIDPTGRFAYVANTITNDVSAYAIDAATGDTHQPGRALRRGGLSVQRRRRPVGPVRLCGEPRVE